MISSTPRQKTASGLRRSWPLIRCTSAHIAVISSAGEISPGIALRRSLARPARSSRSSASSASSASHGSPAGPGRSGVLTICLRSCTIVCAGRLVDSMYTGDTKDDCQCGARISNRGHAQWQHVRSRRHLDWLRNNGQDRFAQWLEDDLNRRAEARARVQLIVS